MVFELRHSTPTCAIKEHWNLHDFDVEYIYGFVWWGVCKQSRWRHSVTVPSQDGGYVLLWQRYDNNKMADMCYYGNVMTTIRWRICVTVATLFYIFNSTVIDWTCLIFFNSSPICPHNFSFHTLSLYFLFDMSHLRTNSIDFSSISEDNQAALIASKHSNRSGGDVITVHIIRIEPVQTGSYPFSHVKHSRSATERNWDVTETFLSVWTSPFNYTWENFTERWRSATERKRDV